jgi:DNA-binding NarL/FixJ family response regulator
VRAVCVSRHRFLSDHLGLFFRDIGLETFAAVGLDEAADAARRHDVDLVLCDYDLLATRRLDEWERDAILARMPVIAVSLTRRPDEVHLLDVNGIAGFLYLPTLSPEMAFRVLSGAARPIVPPPDALLPWRGAVSSAAT